MGTPNISLGSPRNDPRHIVCNKVIAAHFFVESRSFHSFTASLVNDVSSSEYDTSVVLSSSTLSVDNDSLSYSSVDLNQFDS